MGEERYVKQIISDVMEMAAKIKFLEAKVAASESWSAECTDDHKRELAAALDAERANRESLEACVDRDVKKIKDLQTQLSQLQALVRAMSKDFHLGDMRKAEAEAQKWEAEGDMYGWNFHQGRASGIREEQSIVYRIMREHGVDPMKALDATTPAGGRQE